MNEQKLIKIYGERNSGTNYLEQLIALNFEASVLRYVPSLLVGQFLKREFVVDGLTWVNRKRWLGWKHGVPPIDAINAFEGNLSVLTITKNPYTFLLSLHRNPYHNRSLGSLSFSDFIRSPWKPVYRDRWSFRPFANPIDLWNEKNKSYFDLRHHVDKDVVSLTYESLLRDFDMVMERMATRLNLRVKNHKISQLSRSAKSTEQTFDDYRSYYLGQHWRALLLSEDIAYINQFLDRQVVNNIGYELL